jgi:hypothetical protein
MQCASSWIYTYYQKEQDTVRNYISDSSVWKNILFLVIHEQKRELHVGSGPFRCVLVLFAGTCEFRKEPARV